MFKADCVPTSHTFRIPYLHPNLAKAESNSNIHIVLKDPYLQDVYILITFLSIGTCHYSLTS